MRTVRYGLIVSLMALFTSIVLGQTNPSARAIPFTENFNGMAAGTTLPSGFGAWLNPYKSTKVLAEASAPTVDAPIVAASTVQSSGASVYNYNTPAGTPTNSRPYIQVSSNVSNGSDILVAALNTSGYNDVTVAYDVEMINQAASRVSGMSLQYRVGTSGSWTTVSGTDYSGGTNVNGTITNISVTLPSGCNNQPVVQIRWITYEVGTAAGSRDGLGVDNVVTGGTPAASASITASTTSLTSFGDITVGSSSSSVSFTVEGANLSANIVVTPPTGFEIRTGANAFATTPITLTQSSGTVSLTTIDARFTPGSSGTFSANITATSTGATTRNIAVSGNGVTNYYSLGSGDLDVPATWGTSTDGNGSHPSDFTSNYQVFNIRNNSTPTIAANWIVSGTGSKIVLGDGSTAVNFTIPDAMTVTGTIDLAANSTLKLQNATVAHTYGTVNASSTVNYAQSSTATVAVMTFGNLTLTGGTKLFDHGTTTITGNLVIDGVTNVDGATTSAFTTLNIAGNITLQNSSTFNATPTGRMTVNCNGSSVQTITGNNCSLDIFRLTVTNSAGVVLSTTGGTTNVVAGNTSGGGITTTSGNMTTNSNTITLYNSSGSSVLTEGVGHYVIGTISSSKSAVGTAASTMAGLGLSLAAGTDDLGEVTVTRVTGSSGIVTVSANSGISRKYTVASTNPPTAGRDVTVTWISSDDNSKTLTGGVVWKSTNSGSTWSQVSSGDYSSRSVALTGQTSFGVYTISDNTSPLPVELVSFTATAAGRGIELAWKTATEVNNAGFEIQRSEVRDQRSELNWVKVGYVEGNGTSNAPKSYNYTDASAKGTVSYRLKQIDRDGKFSYSYFVNAAAAVTAADYQLSQNFPNPFNPNTNISFAMKNAEHVNVSVYNALGQVVATLFNDVANADHLYTLNFDGKNLSSGTYFYSLRSASRNEVRKMSLMK